MAPPNGQLMFFSHRELRRLKNIFHIFDILYGQFFLEVNFDKHNPDVFYCSHNFVTHAIFSLLLLSMYFAIETGNLLNSVIISPMINGQWKYSGLVLIIKPMKFYILR